MSRRRHAAGVAMPERHPATRHQTILIIVVILASSWLASQPVDPAALMYVLSSLGISAATARRRIQPTGRITPASGKA
ncbi:hypothetical protein ACIPSJ_27135 [Streptomyces sp. NPDC090088]|uniref:hypothetical protein n=1 Tax=Streptomyces sp. NPDC090088 TaxID=3365944 RepID=UPI00381B535A